MSVSMFPYHASGRSNYPSPSHFFFFVDNVSSEHDQCGRRFYHTGIFKCKGWGGCVCGGGLSSAGVKRINALTLAGCIWPHRSTVAELCRTYAATLPIPRDSGVPPSTSTSPIFYLCGRSLQIGVTE